MARYAIIDGITVTNIIEADADFAATIGAIPADAGNTHAAIGGTWDGVQFIAPGPAAEPVPESVTPLQGLLALDTAGLADDYELWANAPERTFAERAFINRAQVWRRDDPLLQAGTGALGMTDAQLDQLFILAATL